VAEVMAAAADVAEADVEEEAAAAGDKRKEP
jgi:hypothetical protein